MKNLILLYISICLAFLFFDSAFIAFCDAPKAFQMTIQDPATDSMEGMIDFYDFLCFQLIIIISIVLTLLISIIFDPIHHSNSERTFSHSTVLETFWTVAPAILLINIAIPSFCLLYSLDDFDYITFNIKIIGHQWYWSYEYLSDQGSAFDSYMISTDDLELGQFRLLEVDNRIYIPINQSGRLLVTSADVLHSFAIPSAGIKVDACPGRLNQASIHLKREGVFYGQCSEICGVNHGFMPIVLVGTSK